MKKTIIKDRWFNPFWSIWLNHLMSRPSCYKCPYTASERGADITMGDLWGVHLYCPELYGKNGGSSLVVCNTEKGKTVFKKAQEKMYGHELAFADALRYQSPMRKCISENPDRDRFMEDLQSDMSFEEINRKWAKKPTLKLLWQKYVWGNRQKIFFWNLKNKLKIKKHNMINFTVGPVQSSDAVRTIGAEQVPYFRTQEFSQLMFENERLVKKFAHATDDSRAVFMTCSGSGGMETAIMNMLTKEDKALVVNGGSFGERFMELLSLHEIPFTEIKLEYGMALKPEHLAPYEGKGYSAFVLQKHETSTGVHFDIKMVSDFCKRNGCFLIVDTISSFLADPFDMADLDAGVMITGSQKALACPPGIAIMVLAPSALKRIEKTKCCCQYLDLKLALKNQDRGQTPWTPAVGVLRQINVRLKEIDANGGAEAEVERTAKLANYFRNKIKEHNLPFEIISESLSNAVTPLHPTTQSANEIFLKIKDEYGMWICPNGGDLKDKVFRVGHIGYLQEKDYDQLIDAFLDLREKKFI